MRKSILKYKSDPKVYDIQSKAVPYHDVIDELSISEYFQENGRYKHILPTLGHYQLVIETEVNNTSEIKSNQVNLKAKFGRRSQESGARSQNSVFLYFLLAPGS